jgi:hypothetical protein
VCSSANKLTSITPKNSNCLIVCSGDLKTKSKVTSKNKERDITRIEGSFQNQEPDNTG